MFLLPSPDLIGKEVTPIMEIIIGIALSFLVSVAAGVLANFLYDLVCKWLNGSRK